MVSNLPCVLLENKIEPRFLPFHNTYLFGYKEYQSVFLSLLQKLFYLNEYSLQQRKLLYNHFFKGTYVRGENPGSFLHLLSNKTLYKIQRSCRIPYSSLAFSSKMADLNFCSEASKQTNMNLGLPLQVNCSVLFWESVISHFRLLPFEDF